MRVRRICLWFIVAFFAMISAYAQEYRGRLQGVVSDPTNAVIAGANVQLTNIDKGNSVSRMSDNAGRYLFDLVEPGRYTVTIEAQGFTRFVQENVLVQNRGDITVNAQLRIGNVNEAITVVSEAPAAVQFNTSRDRKSTRLNSSHSQISYAVFC